jgi:hypothetical protein
MVNWNRATKKPAPSTFFFISSKLKATPGFNDILNEEDLISGFTDFTTGKVKSALLMALLHILQVNPLA